MPPRRCTVSVGGMDLELGPGNQHKVNWGKTRLSSALVTIKTQIPGILSEIGKILCSLTLIFPEFGHHLSPFKTFPNVVTCDVIGEALLTAVILQWRG